MKKAVVCCHLNENLPLTREKGVLFQLVGEILIVTVHMNVKRICVISTREVIHGSNVFSV